MIAINTNILLWLQGGYGDGCRQTLAALVQLVLVNIGSGGGQSLSFNYCHW